MKLKPFILEVIDENEILLAADFYKRAGIKLKYQVLDRDCVYHYAVFYQNFKDAKPLIEKHERLMRKYET